MIKYIYNIILIMVRTTVDFPKVNRFGHLLSLIILHEKASETRILLRLINFYNRFVGLIKPLLK